MADLERGTKDVEAPTDLPAVAQIGPSVDSEIKPGDHGITPAPQDPISEGEDVSRRQTSKDNDDSIRLELVPSYLSLSEAEQIVGAMHFRNVEYLRAKVISNRIIVRTGVGAQKLQENPFEKVCTVKRLDQTCDDLARYTAALRDYDYWKHTYKRAASYGDRNANAMIKEQVILAFPEDNSLFNAEVQAEAKDLLVSRYNRLKMRSRSGTTRGAGIEPYSGITREHGLMMAHSEIATRRSLFLSRLSFALFGGLALIAPMLIMTLHQTKLTVFLTTSIFGVAVALVLALFMEGTQNKDIVAATAAYAAVLVVFIGTAVTPPSSSGS